ncbi:MAG: PepSY-associated TM helix domain-containing protein [Thermoguttaceae bacterium]
MHRWLGLSAGLLFALLGLTGSLLVFDHAIDEWLHPGLLLCENVGVPHSPSEIVLAAERAYLQHPAPTHSVVAPRVPGGVWSVWFRSSTEGGPRWTQVCVDPYTARVTGQRRWGDDLMSWIYGLHFALHGGKIGKTIVGIAGLLSVISVGTGVLLWWPLWKTGWRAAFAIRRGYRFSYDLHKTSGIIASPVFVVVALTGVYMVFPEYVKPLVTSISRETLPPAQLASVPDGESHPLKPEEAIGIAEAFIPETASFCHFHPPHGADGVYEVVFRQPGEAQRSFGRTQIWIDAYSGDVLAERYPRDFTAADRFIAWQFPLHNGEALGLVGRWAVFLAGFAPAILYGTGVVIWWRKRRSRYRQQRNRWSGFEMRSELLQNEREAPPFPCATRSTIERVFDR